MLRHAFALGVVGVALVVTGSGVAAKTNGKIAFAAGAVPAGGGTVANAIYVANANGGGRVKLTSGGDNAYPAFSPDGARIAFTSDRAGDYAVFVMGADGSAPAQLTPPLGASSPAWSPDGSTIAFTVSRGETHDIYTVAAAGGTPRLVQRNAIGPAWSPNGSKLAFSGDSDNRLYWSSGAAGTRHRVITRSGLAYEQSPSWSPDGKKLVFTGDVADKPQVWIVGVDGGALKRLTSSATIKSYPVFSPNGTRIVYADGGKLVSMKPDGTGATTLASGVGSVSGITWAAGAGGGSGGGASANPHHCTILGAKTGKWEPVAPGSKAKLFVINGTSGADVICGTPGADRIRPGAGDDVVWAGAGDDIVDGSPGNDTIYGEAGKDNMNDGEGADTIVGGDGDDYLLAADAGSAVEPDVVQGGAGNDLIVTFDNHRDTVDGGPGNDRAWRDPGVDVLANVEQTVDAYGNPVP